VRHGPRSARAAHVGRPPSTWDAARFSGSFGGCGAKSCSSIAGSAPPCPLAAGEHIDPPLTTVDFGFRKQDEMVIGYLVDLIDQPDMELHRRVLLPELPVRGSTRRREA